MPASRNALIPSSSRSAGRDPTGRFDHAQDRKRQGRFTRPGLARQPEPLAWGEGEANVVDRLHQALWVVEADAQALNLQNQFAHLLLRWLGRQLEESLLHGGLLGTYIRRRIYVPV